MSVGAMEIPEQLETNRRFRDALAVRGYAVSYSEFNGNHSYFSWRGDLARRLVHLIGPPQWLECTQIWSGAAGYRISQ